MNSLPFPDPRRGVLMPQSLQQDVSSALLYSNDSSERFGHIVQTAPIAALPVSYVLSTSTRVDPNAENLTRGVLPALTVGPLPSAFGVSYDGS